MLHKVHPVTHWHQLCNSTPHPTSQAVDDVMVHRAQGLINTARCVSLPSLAHLLLVVARLSTIDFVNSRDLVSRRDYSIPTATLTCSYF